MSSGDYLDFDIGIALLSAYDENGFIGVQVDGNGAAADQVSNNARLEGYEMHAINGLLAMPDDPGVDGSGQAIPEQSCSVLFAREGGGAHAHAFVVNDPRAYKVLPKLKKGGSVRYGARGRSFDLIDGATGSQTQYVAYAFVNNVPTKAMAITVNVDTAGKEFISILHGDGTRVQLADGKVTITNNDRKTFVTVGKGVEMAGGLNVRGQVVLGDETAKPLVIADVLINYLAQLELALTKASPPIVPPIPIATIAAAMATSFTSAS